MFREISSAQRVTSRYSKKAEHLLLLLKGETAHDARFDPSISS